MSRTSIGSSGRASARPFFAPCGAWPASSRNRLYSASCSLNRLIGSGAIGRGVSKARRSNVVVDLGPLPGLIGYALRRAQVVVFQDFFRTFATFDIRPAQLAVLIVIERNPGLKQSQVCAALGIKRTNFVGLLDSLQRRGLAERRPAAQDRRSHALHLTADGVALLRKLKPLMKMH